MRRTFGSIEQLQPNQFRCRWYDGIHRKSKTIRGTKKEAEKFLAMVEFGLAGADDKTTYDEYWQTVVQPSNERLSVKTRTEYNRLWNKELQPRIGHLRVADTTFRSAQRVISDIEAPTVQKKAKVLWHKICRMAVEQDRLLEYNPISRDIYTEPHKKREKTLVAARDVRGFMEFIRGLKYELVFLCELGGGLSPEEACALTMQDFETDGEYVCVTINKTLVTCNGKKVLQQSTKNQFRERQCLIGKPFAARIIELLKEGNQPICPSNTYIQGRKNLTEEDYTSPATITHNWREYCKRHDYPYTSQGNMRSSWATLQGEAGSEDSLCSLAMGHAPTTTRGKNYMKNTIRGMMLIADNLSDYLSQFDPR